MYNFLKISVLVLLFSCAAQVGAATYNPEQRQDVAEFIDSLVQEHKLDKTWLQNNLSQAQQRQDILELIARPAERTRAWYEYQTFFITQKRIDDGRIFMRKHKQALAEAEAAYGVPAEIISAIIGIETSYGANKGRHRVIDALSTLTFDYPPRAKFFRSQLVEYLRFTYAKELNPLLPMGSYAGAMGYPQFMPTSYRDFAVDFDQDGLADIWNNPVDAIGSVANYFVKHGWRKNQPVLVAAQQPKKPNLVPDLRANSFKLIDFSEAKRAGMVVSGTKLDAKTKVMPMAFALENGEEYVLGLQNFYVITRYNHSRMYALAVYELSEALRK